VAELGCFSWVGELICNTTNTNKNYTFKDMLNIKKKLLGCIFYVENWFKTWLKVKLNAGLFTFGIEILLKNFLQHKYLNIEV
jgi:hypothetical protein